MPNSIVVLEISADRYLITAPLGDGRVCETVCVCREMPTALGQLIHGLQFESEEFNRRIMRGDLDIFSIRQALNLARQANKKPPHD